MASFPHNFYSDFFYPNTFSDVQGLLMAAGTTHNNINNNNVDFSASAGDHHQIFTPPFDRNMSPDALSSLPTMPCPDFCGPVSDMAVPTQIPDFNTGLYGIHSLIGSQPPVLNACEYDNELFGFVPDLKPLYQNTWGSQNSYDQMMNGAEETNIKVASRYSEEERKERILRYLKKRNQRNFNKTIKYACRKTLADRRTRVRGRFARNNNDLCDTQIPLETNQLTTPTNSLIKQRDQTNKEEEESWLQELAANLIYLPYVTNYNGLGNV